MNSFFWGFFIGIAITAAAWIYHVRIIAAAKAKLAADLAASEAYAKTLANKLAAKIGL